MNSNPNNEKNITDIDEINDDDLFSDDTEKLSEEAKNHGENSLVPSSINADKDSDDTTVQDQDDAQDQPDASDDSPETEQVSETLEVEDLDGIEIEFEDRSTAKDLPVELTSTEDIDLSGLDNTINNPAFTNEDLLDFFSPKELSSLTLSAALQIYVAIGTKVKMSPRQAIASAVEFIDESIREEAVTKYFNDIAKKGNYEESIYDRGKRMAIKRAQEQLG